MNNYELLQSSKGGALSLKVEKDSSPWGHSDFSPADDNVKSTSAYNWGDDVNSDDFFSTLVSDGQPKVS